jgi:membrane associated rhomboid family serine protease
MGPVVKNILILNVLMFIISFTFEQGSVGGTNLNKILGLYYFGSEQFRPFQLITHMFMHGGTMHLFLNMFALVMFGVQLERVWGSKRFLIYYFVAGFGASLLQVGVNWFQINQLLSNMSVAEAMEIKELIRSSGYEILSQGKNYSEPILGKLNLIYNVPMVGASGAVFGILLGFGMLFPNTELIMLFLPVPIKAKYFVIIYGLIELFSGISNRPGDNIAHFAHVGGMIFGFFLIKYWQKMDRRNFY